MIYSKRIGVTARFGSIIFGLIAIVSCSQQAATPPIARYPAAPIPLTPPAVRQPVTEFSLPSAASQPISGFEVRGSGQTIMLPTSTAGTSETNAGITFNFVNASVTAVARTIFGELLKENYTIDGGVQGTITLQTTRPLALDEIIPALETSLQSANMALTLESDGYHIVPLANAAQASAGNLSIAGGQQTPGYGTEIIPLKYANAAAIEKLVQPLAQANVQIQADTGHNTLIVSGSSQDRAAIAANVAVFDVNWLAGMSYALVPMQSASAQVVAKEVEQIIDGTDSPISGVVRLVVISQLNAILIITQQDQYLSQVRSWITRFDQQQQSDERQVYIYRVQNGRASDIAKILSELMGQNSTNNSSAQSSPSNADSNDTSGNSDGTGGDTDSGTNSLIPNGNSSSGIPNMTPPSSAFAGNQGNNPDQTAVGNQNGGNDQQSLSADQNDSDQDAGDTSDEEAPPRITADDDDNDLLIYATPAQYQAMSNALVQLDVQPMQVMLEAVVAEVTLNSQLQYGVQYFFQSGRLQSTNTIGTVANAISPVVPGFSAILSPGSNIQIILNALESITHVNVISAPKLLVLNNQPAVLQVGDEVPITTQTAESTDTANAPLVSTIQYQPTGVILHVTPRINEGGLVTLDVSQEVSEVSTTTSSTLNSPTISERKISTIVAVPDGQTVALGGLIQTNTTIANGGIPLLDRIPVLGYLFSNHNTTGTRTELLVLITPHVVQSASSLEAVTDTLRNELSDVQP